jgi:hydroxyethylthiazole kinase-like uncharacterized protein yjeF
MRLIRTDQFEALHDTGAHRRLEAASAARLPPHTLMARAGSAVARLARALQPHAQCIWVACGPGNNGGDGLVAATLLHQWAQTRGGRPRVIASHWLGSSAEPAQLPEDARHALLQARAAGVAFSDEPPADFDLAIDAVFGIGQRRAAPPERLIWLELLQKTAQTVLCVDLPSQLQSDTGAWHSPAGSAAPASGVAGPRHTLSLLSLKPGLFTAHGRDLAGQAWLDDLQTDASPETPTAWLAGRSAPVRATSERAHASHKGRYGDVGVIGGQGLMHSGVGMTGAALLAARAALQAGAGRVLVGLLGEPADGQPIEWDVLYPELMFRQHSLLTEPGFMGVSAIVCGCGGGSQVAAVLLELLAGAPRLVLDADALNAVAASPALQQALQQRHRLGWTTVLTPHPLEAARLLGCDTRDVMAGRLQAAQSLSDRFQAVCVLKGSGTVIAAPAQRPLINPTGCAALATAGTGDVLAGMIGSALALPDRDASQTLDLVAQAVFQHGWLADHWGTAAEPLRAGLLAARVQPLN